MNKTQKILSIGLASIMAFSTLTPMAAMAADYTGLPVYQEMKEDNLSTAPELKLNETYDVVFRSGTYTNSNGTNYYIVTDNTKVVKFIPETTGYYEASIYVAERNQHMSVKFGYSDPESLKDDKYYIVNNGDYEMSVHTSKEPGIYESEYTVYRNTARAGAYLEKGKTYYIIGHSTYDDYNVEKEMKSEAKGYTYHNVPATMKVYKHTHDNKVELSKYSDHTYAYYRCKVCGYSFSSSFYKPTKLTLSATSYTYDGKTKKPSVVVKDSIGNKISNSYYTTTYSSGRKNVGKYKVTVKFKGEYARFGSLTKTFTINPKTTSISKLTPAKKGFKVTWKKQATQTSGYQIRYSTKSSMSGAKTITISKNSTTAKSISKLNSKKKYYVQVRTYKTISGTKCYSSWSAKKNVTTK